MTAPLEVVASSLSMWDRRGELLDEIQRKAEQELDEAAVVADVAVVGVVYCRKAGNARKLPQHTKDVLIRRGRGPSPSTTRPKHPQPVCRCMCSRLQTSERQNCPCAAHRARAAASSPDLILLLHRQPPEALQRELGRAISWRFGPACALAP